MGSSLAKSTVLTKYINRIGTARTEEVEAKNETIEYIPQHNYGKEMELKPPGVRLHPDAEVFTPQLGWTAAADLQAGYTVAVGNPHHQYATHATLLEAVYAQGTLEKAYGLRWHWVDGHNDLRRISDSHKLQVGKAELGHPLHVRPNKDGWHDESSNQHFKVIGITNKWVEVLWGHTSQKGVLERTSAQGGILAKPENSEHFVLSAATPRIQTLTHTPTLTARIVGEKFLIERLLQTREIVQPNTMGDTLLTDLTKSSWHITFQTTQQAQEAMDRYDYLELGKAYLRLWPVPQSPRETPSSMVSGEQETTPPDNENSTPTQAE